MAENKQYITQTKENGAVLISEDVITAIVAHVVNEVEGVAGLASKPGADIISKKNWGKGMKISITQDNAVQIDCNIVVKYGHSVMDVATAVQDSVSNALESMAGVAVASVNVNVSGILRA